MTDWSRRACRDTNTALFFVSDAATDPEGNPNPDYSPAYADTIVELREDYCARCPVRRRCFTEVMKAEAGAISVDYRSGFQAGLTPGQRHALARRGIWQCPSCGEAFDPLAFTLGELECDCGTAWSVRPLPADGAAWFDRHTELGEKVVAWMIETTAPGDVVPLPTHLARSLKARKEDMVQVYEALLLDGTLERCEKPKRYVRVGQTAAMQRWRRWHLAVRATAA